MTQRTDGPAQLICQAIQQRRQLAFDYNGRRRIVAPYCYGISTKDNESLRAIEVGGGKPFGKLWTLSEMSRIELSDRHFVPNDPNYNPNDSAMKRVICRID